ncbi:MAG TPA: DUF4287 domain-containing protein [Egicoccus sp.]|nr:DUF4287 domain-containing protein [Egicoccus sp.]HSK22751.1 DUF4287 domain-containing protein [Egicoccus sp.]
MATPEQQVATQLANIERDHGLTPTRVAELVRDRGLEKHGQIIALLKAEHGMGHGNANLLATKARELLAGGPARSDDLLAAQYAGAKVHLRAIHDRLVELARSLGDDVEVVVQKTGVSLRRRKQFAVLRPVSSKRAELGLNLPGTPADARIEEASGMCSHRLYLHDATEVDTAVAGWLRQAYDRAG